MSFSDDLKAELSEPPAVVDVPFTLNKTGYVLRAAALQGWEWADELDRHPARPDAAFDRIFGYNIRAIVQAVAPRCMTLLKDDEPVAVTVDPAEGVDEWADLLKAMSGSTVQRLCNAVFQLNEPDSEVVSLAKKAQRAAAATSN